MKNKKISTKEKTMINKRVSFLSLFILLYLTIGLGLVISALTFFTYQKIDLATASLVGLVRSRQDTIIKISKKPERFYPLPTPEKVKGIYLTGYTFSDDQRRNALIKLVEQTELNTLVIDLHDPNGKIIFTPESKKLKPMLISPAAMSNKKFKKILSELRAKKIYTIARISTFQDMTIEQSFPELALKDKQGKIWQNWQGISWFDMTNPLVWEIPVEQAKEAKKLGFDEVQFDYVRFPSDGDISQIKYFYFPPEEKKHQVLADFYKYISISLKGLKLPLSIDLFGLTYQLQENPEYDLNIGQRLADASPYFDFICPMLYPSHYPTNHLGFNNPAEHPYEIIDQALQDGDSILKNTPNSKAQTRPWLQDFDMGANYNSKMLREEIRACDKNNTAGWLLWNARNVYTQNALEKE